MDDRQACLRDRAVEALQADERVLAAWLVGSFWTGQADRWSDLDVHCCVADDAFDGLAGNGWKRVLAAITPTVMAVTFPPPTVGGYSLTPEWQQIDLVFHRRSDVGEVDGTLLFDRTGELVFLPPREPIYSPPTFPRQTVDWFFYMFGKLAAVVGRNDPVLGVQGATTMLYTCLVPLFLAECGGERIGGAKRLRPFLDEEQYALLEGLPPLECTLESVIASELAQAAIFVPRARALAEALGGEWPEELEWATCNYLTAELGRPVGPFALSVDPPR